jgi:hypothetical protein
VLLSSGDSFPHLIQKPRSQLGFVSYLLNRPRSLMLSAFLMCIVYIKARRLPYTYNCTTSFFNLRTVLMLPTCKPNFGKVAHITQKNEQDCCVGKLPCPYCKTSRPALYLTQLPNERVRGAPSAIEHRIWKERSGAWSWLLMSVKCRDQECAELYLHSPIRFHGVMLN